MAIQIKNLATNPPSDVVASVVPGSPAARMGLRVGDRIVEIDGNAVSPDQIPELLSNSALAVSIGVIRGGATLVLPPAQPQGLFGSVPRMGFTLGAGAPGPKQLRSVLIGRIPVAGVRG
jgi:membrane-associated protease RseP (regulator of RpoE activity)